MNEFLKIQQGTITLIKREIKEIKQIIKVAKKDAKATGSNEIYGDLKESLKPLETNINFVEGELNKLRFKNATADSVSSIRQYLELVKEQKEILLEAYNEVVGV